jgi:hypothetical protein
MAMSRFAMALRKPKRPGHSMGCASSAEKARPFERLSALRMWLLPTCRLSSGFDCLPAVLRVAFAAATSAS